MTTNRAPVITIDGPSGSGKGTVGQMLASTLGWHFLDSGALYRITALAASDQAISLDDEAKIAELAKGLDIQFRPQENAPPIVRLNGNEVGERLRTETIAEIASRVAAMPLVRAALLEKQQAFAQMPGLVADGRDMGTNVFPDAKLKIYLIASPEIRAQRRYKQLMEKGFDVSLARLLTEIQERDARDQGRAVSPLKPASDAHILDSSGLNAQEVMQQVLELLELKPA
jgi:cytidylate kinase